MVPGISTDTLIHRVLDDAKAKKDFIVPATDVEVMDGDRLVWDDTSSILTPHAMGQLSTYLGIPARFIERLRTDDPALINIAINRLLQTKKDDRRMVRTLRGEARAWMSDQYRRLDHEDVAERVLPMIKKAGYEITSANITASRLYLHVVSPRAQGEVRVGDTVRFGWVISNSEIGTGAFNLRAFAERLVCGNGMILTDFSKRRAHIGGRSEVVGDSYLVSPSTATQAAADRALWMGVEDHIRQFTTPKGIEAILGTMRAQAEATVKGDPTAVTEALANKFLLREDETRSVLYSFLEQGDHTRWGLANAVTQVANTSDYDRAVELEKIGGEVMTTTGTLWRSISDAQPQEK